MLEVTVSQLTDRYQGFLLDAYGVLVNSERTLPGANEFLGQLRQRGIPFRLVSNDGSTTPEAKAARWSERGLEVEPEFLLTPWSVLASEFSPLSLEGKGCHIIGTPLSEEMLLRAGGHLVDTADRLEVFLLADELTVDFMASCDRALSLLTEAFRSGAEPQLVLVNPDLVYPSGEGFGFTAGAIALMFEAALERILGRPVTFVRVGKPGPELFLLGLKELGLQADQVVMLGDQWETDLAGAKAAGIHAALVGTGLGQPRSDGGDWLYLPNLLT